MNAREHIKYRIHRLERAPGLEDELEALRCLDALLAEAVKIFGHGHENPDSVSACPECAWMIKAMKLGYGPEDK